MWSSGASAAKEVPSRVGTIAGCHYFERGDSSTQSQSWKSFRRTGSGHCGCVAHRWCSDGGAGVGACLWSAGDLTSPSIDFTVRKSQRHLSEQHGAPWGDLEDAVI